MNEDTIQLTFKNWCDKQDKILTHWHVANERQTSLKIGAYLKALGVKKGVPDYWVLLKNKKLLVIEFKTEKGTVSIEQKNFLQMLSLCDIPNRVCRSSHEAVLFVKENW